MVVGNDPRQLQFAFALWTRAMVRELIGRDVRCAAVGGAASGRLLRKLGLSPQRPLYRAYQQNPQAVARWKSEVYPQFRAEAAEVGATIYFADEAGGALGLSRRDHLGAGRSDPGGRRPPGIGSGST